MGPLPQLPITSVVPSLSGADLGALVKFASPAQCKMEAMATGMADEHASHSVTMIPITICNAIILHCMQNTHTIMYSIQHTRILQQCILLD